jgi:antitoxin component of MazEF toxin-antitoxin module
VAHLVTLLYVGGMLNCPIPRALVRELGLVKRERVYVARGKGRAILIEPLDDYLRTRSGTTRTPAR